MLKLTLEELGLISDWERVNSRLILEVLEDMWRRDVWDFGYKKYPDAEGDIYGPFLGEDINEIVFSVSSDEFF